MPPTMPQHSAETTQEVKKALTLDDNKPYTPQATTSSVGAGVSNGPKNRKLRLGGNKLHTPRAATSSVGAYSYASQTKGALTKVRMPPTMLQHSVH
eukprot:344675-Karenia_brevis.AAC.1